MGTYELVETNCSNDWLLSTEVYTVQVAADGTVTVTGNQNPAQADGRYLIPDEPRIHGDLYIHKQDSITGNTVANAEFRLSGTSYYGNDILMFAASDGSGNLSFKDVELGSYTLAEVTAPEGYIRTRATWQVIVDADGLATLYTAGEDGSLTPAGQNDKWAFVIANEPLHQFSFLKTSTYGANVRIAGVEFSLTGISDYGTEVSRTAVSSGQEGDYGLVTFADLEPGTYTLRETKTEGAKDNSGLNDGAGLTYTPDGKAYTVVIGKDGKFTVSGLGMLELNIAGEAVKLYNFPNTPNTGVVKVTKIWLDGEDGGERRPSDIDLTISTGLPDPGSYGGKAVTFNAGDGSFPGMEAKA